MQKLGYYNGTCGPLDEMTVPMNDRASWFGDGVYDAGLSRNYHIFCGLKCLSASRNWRTSSMTW